MVVIQAIDAGNTDMFHRLLLDGADDILPRVYGLGTGGWGVEDGAHLVLLQHGVERILINLPHHLGVAGVDVEVKLLQLLDDVGIFHAHQLGDLFVFESCFQQFVAHLTTVQFRVGYLHLAETVDAELQHLAYFLVERHLADPFLHVFLDGRILRNGRLYVLG